MIEIAGKEAAEGYLMNDPDYGSDIYPEATRQLYAEFQQRYPGSPLALTTYLGNGCENKATRLTKSGGPKPSLFVFCPPSRLGIRFASGEMFKPLQAVAVSDESLKPR